MKTTQELVSVQTSGQGFTDVTPHVRRAVAASGVGTGMCSVFLRHTSASLVIQENADPAVRRDLARWIASLCPEDAARWEHADEGPDDMPAHLRAAMTHTSESVPVREGAPALGTWQSVWLWEHRRGAHRRELVLTVWGEPLAAP